MQPTPIAAVKVSFHKELTKLVFKKILEMHLVWYYGYYCASKKVVFSNFPLILNNKVDNIANYLL